MSQAFAYEALTSNGEVARGELRAESELELEVMLRDQGSFLIRAEAVAEAPAGGAARRELTDGVLPRRELLALTEYLLGSIRAGIPLLTALYDVELHLDGKRAKRIVAEIRASISEQGKSLSEALAEHPRAFPPLYVSTVEGGENTGQLDFVLEQLVEYLEWQREITLQIRQATMYPALVLLVMGGLLVMLVSFVFPKLLPVFTGFGVAMPLPTRIVFGVGTFLRAYWGVLLAVLAAAGAGLLLSGRSEPGRLALDTGKLRVPIFGPLLHQIEMSRVVTYMALFYRTGVDLIRGLELLERIVINRRVALAIGQARRAIIGGDSIAHAFAATGLFPSVVIRSFALGEATGRLDESLDRARGYYAREVPAAVRRMLTALQPLLIVVLGLILGMVALSIFLPIMRIYQEVG